MLVDDSSQEYEPGKRAWRNASPIGTTLFKMFKVEFTIAFASLLLYMSAMALQPFVSRAILDFLNGHDNGLRIQSGYVLVALMTIVSLVGVTSLNYGVFMLSRIGVSIRSVVLTLVYQKALRLSCVRRTRQVRS